MKKIAIANMKGGVGKTTTAIILCDALSAVYGKRVLALDLDSQANLSWALMAPEKFAQHAPSATMTRWLEKLAQQSPSSLPAVLVDVGLASDQPLIRFGGEPTPDATVQLAVADTSMRFPEMHFEGPLGPTDPSNAISEALAGAIGHLEQNFDYCVMDCSPALSAMTRGGLRIADSIMIPTPLNNLCYTSAVNFQDVALQGALNLRTPVFVVSTRVGMSTGKREANHVRELLRLAEADGRWRRLDPEFPERAEYMRALDPPAIAPFRTLRSRYGSRVGDLRAFLFSLEKHGVI